MAKSDGVCAFTRICYAALCHKSFDFSARLCRHSIQTSLFGVRRRESIVCVAAFFVVVVSSRESADTYTYCRRMSFAAETVIIYGRGVGYGVRVHTQLFALWRNNFVPSLLAQLKCRRARARAHTH